MRWKMLFRIGMTVVVLVGIILFYLNNILNNSSKKEKISESELVRSDNLVIEEAIMRHKNGKQSLTSEAKQKEQQSEDGRNDEGDSDKEEESDTMNRRRKGGGDGGERGGDAAQNGGRRKEEGVPSGLAADRGVHKENGAKAFAGLQPLRRRVGQQVHTQVHVIHLAVVACGDRAEETLVMLKSAVLLTPSTPLVLHIFAEQQLHAFFVGQLSYWPEEVLDRMEYRVYDITFPVSENAEQWKNMFKLCAAQRLFIPTLLQDVDSVIYVDTDVLFISPLTKLWSFFARFNRTQLVALAPEQEDPSTGWYNRFARHPYVPPHGVNSGVMLMNLTRLRGSTWLASLLAYYKEYRLKITWGDQDLINIYFHFHPDELYLYTCEWNYRPDHCMYMSVCKPAEQHGAFVIHGCRRVMHNDKQPAFKAMYTAFRNYEFGQDIEKVLLQNMKNSLKFTTLTPCGKVPQIFLKQVQEFIVETTMVQPIESSNQAVPHG